MFHKIFTLLCYRYSLIGDGDGKFQIHPSTGVITTAVELDREAGASSYRLVAKAMDQASLPLTSTTEITVTVEDDNDNAPQFLQSEYTQYLRDPTVTGRHIILCTYRYVGNEACIKVIVFT